VTDRVRYSLAAAFLAIFVAGRISDRDCLRRTERGSEVVLAAVGLTVAAVASPVLAAAPGRSPRVGHRLLTCPTATERRMWRFIMIIAFAVTMVFVTIGRSNVDLDETTGSIRIGPAGAAHVAQS
jgi:hypothetical protein